MACAACNRGFVRAAAVEDSTSANFADYQDRISEGPIPWVVRNIAWIAATLVLPISSIIAISAAAQCARTVL